MSQGSVAIFFASPIAATVNGLAVLFFLWPAAKALRAWLRRAPAKPAAALQDVPASER
ncbi:MAG: hypothetical protein H6Q85_1725, partial [candidate division NC10 bacterium]|nr:hypothetical protein [candidate division NC10 bacterium]